MKKILYLTLCVVLFTIATCVDIEPQNPNVTVVPAPGHSNITTVPPPTTSTTLAPPTPAPTTVPTKPTTTSPTKPTTAPTTAPTKPTTAPTQPTTAPTQPTTAPTKPTTKPTAPTTTQAPITSTTPAPKKEIGTWVLNYTNSNHSCIIMKMELEFRVPYTKTDNKTGNATIFVPKTAVADGNCGDGKAAQNITLKWKADNGNLSSATFSFALSNSTKQYMLASISTSLIPDVHNFPNASSNNTISAALTKNEFETPVSMSYRCLKEETLHLPMTNVKNETVCFIVSNMQIQAFHNSTSKDFSTAEDCETTETPGIVPIAVGCSLAALIIIVLIAFLIGRRRSQPRGYLSMFSETKREEEYIPMKNLSCFGK